MTTKRITVRIPLLFGDQTEIVADVSPAERGELERHPASVIAASVAVSVSDLPNVRLTADIGDDHSLYDWQLT
ncbi:hypothetical protein [Streptomyces tendae]|uniref:hypothetical protein n=1 Tax=Streptomyces tendae TaxID=1932 RepID=UPI0033AAE7DB